MSAPTASRPIRVTFVNSGILGLQTFSEYIREAMGREPRIEATHVNLSEGLTARERLIRRAMCARFWPDGFAGLSNLDLARFRCEYHSGLQAARRLRRAPAPDVLHFHRDATAYASLGLMRRVPGLVSIDTTQDIVIDAARSPLERATYLLNARRAGAVFRAAAAVIATSAWAAGCLRRRYPDCRTPVAIMPTPVRLAHFDAGWAAERRRRPADALPRVLFVGSDFDRKGGRDLLAAWRDGGFAGRAALDLVTGARLGPLPAGVTVHRGVSSYSPEWTALWRAADVFAMPTRSDAFPNVYQEAAAAALPRIGTRITAVPEMIDDGRSGRLIPPADRAALAAALDEFVAHPERRRACGEAARADVVRTADPDGYRERLVALIDQAARVGPPGARA